MGPPSRTWWRTWRIEPPNANRVGQERGVPPGGEGPVPHAGDMDPPHAAGDVRGLLVQRLRPQPERSCYRHQRRGGEAQQVREVRAGRPTVGAVDEARARANGTAHT